MDGRAAGPAARDERRVGGGAAERSLRRVEGRAPGDVAREVARERECLVGSEGRGERGEALLRVLGVEQRNLVATVDEGSGKRAAEGAGGARDRSDAKGLFAHARAPYSESDASAPLKAT